MREFPDERGRRLGVTHDLGDIDIGHCETVGDDEAGCGQMGVEHAQRALQQAAGGGNLRLSVFRFELAGGGRRGDAQRLGFERGCSEEGPHAGLGLFLERCRRQRAAMLSGEIEVDRHGFDNDEPVIVDRRDQAHGIHLQKGR